jgi:hypothetical protein
MATCEACHPQRDFAAAPTHCSGCHAKDDAHRGALGNDCGSCHTDTGEVTFTHAMSRFPLDGAHREVPCRDCHPSKAFRPRPHTCFGCHPEPRDHVGRFGPRCDRCHTTQSFAETKRAWD